MGIGGRLIGVLGAVVVAGLLAGTAGADVFNMGPGLTSLEWVTVGNPGNANDDTGYGAVGYTYNIVGFRVASLAEPQGAAPEPATAAMCVLGVAAVACRTRRG